VRRRLAGIALAALAMAACGALAMLGLRWWVGRKYDQRIYGQVGQVPPLPVAIVFGAGYWPAGTASDTTRLSDALADRMETAMDLYRAGKVNKLLLTGDNRFVDYNEPAAMAEYATSRGIPPEDLVLDYAGRRTYDSCYRATAIFGAKQAVLVTQRFHLPRALFTCDQLGLDVVGIVADRHRLFREPWYRLREVAALARAWIDLTLLKPLPVLGDPIPIDWTQGPKQE
jgi:SanA protein